MVLEDRSGNDDPTTLTKNAFGVSGRLRNRPQNSVRRYLPTSRAYPSFTPDVLYGEKALQQQVSLSEHQTTMQTFMGGYLVNYFNRFGRQWQT